MSKTFRVCYITRTATRSDLFRVVFIGDGGVSLALDGLTSIEVGEYSAHDELGQPRPTAKRFKLTAEES